MEMPRMMTIKQAAMLAKENDVGISERGIRRLCAENRISCIKVGVKTLLNWNGLLEYLQAPPVPTQVKAETIGKVRRIPEKIDKNSRSTSWRQ